MVVVYIPESCCRLFVVFFRKLLTCRFFPTQTRVICRFSLSICHFFARVSIRQHTHTSLAVMFGCLTPMSLVFKSIPYLIAVVWILTSAIYDVTFVLQQSLFLCFYFYITDAIERLLAYSLKVFVFSIGWNLNESLNFQVDKQVIFSYINSTSLAVLFANFLGLSIYTRSYSRWTTLCASIYGLIIQLIEPMLMLIEIIQVIRFILSVGQMLREKIFDSEDDERMSSIMKGLTIVLTVAAVAIALLLGVSICQTQSSLFTTQVFTVNWSKH